MAFNAAGDGQHTVYEKVNSSISKDLLVFTFVANACARVDTTFTSLSRFVGVNLSCFLFR